MSNRVVHKGMPGHFIAVSNCCFHLHSVVDGRWKISTVGCYHDRSTGLRSYDNREEIGCGRLYETMVFDNEADGWSELDCVGYNEESDADAGHFAMIEKWLNKSVQESEGGDDLVRALDGAKAVGAKLKARLDEDFASMRRGKDYTK